MLQRREVAGVADGHVDAQHRRRRPREGGGEIHHRAVQEVACQVVALAVRHGTARPDAGRQLVVELEAAAEFVGVRLAAQPLALRGAENAQLGARAEAPERSGVGGQKVLVEVAARILPQDRVDAQAKRQALVSRLPPPHGNPEAGLGAKIPLAREGQASEGGVDVDDLAFRGGVEVGVRGRWRRRNSRSSACGPA